MLREITGKKAIIFDLDGVLVDTTPIHEKAFREILSDLASNFDYKKYTGMSTKEALIEFFSRMAVKKSLAEIDALAEKKQARTLELLSSIKPFSYAENLLKLLKRNRLKVALATSASGKRAEIILKKSKLKKYFDVVVSAEDIEKTKPASDIYEKTLQSLRLKSKNAIVIEDAPNGINAAKKASLFAIAVLNTHKESELKEADLIVKDLHSLYVLLNYHFAKLNFREDRKYGKIKKVTTIIPAAGSGTRFNFNKPKILYSISGKPVINILYEKLRSISKKIIVITNPQDAPYVQEHIKNGNLDIKVVTVYNSAGTADSILAGKSAAKNSEDVLIIWGDQVSIEPESLKKLVFLHQKNDAHLSMPTLLRKKPYIHLERDGKGKIIKVLRQRFKDDMPEYGENDSGVFVLKNKVLFSTLKKMKSKYKKKSQNPAEEFDFLDIIPVLSNNHNVITTACVKEHETIGMNTLKEAKFHEKIIENKKWKIIK